jgi:acyl-homoserine lactone acylase PvdQ
MKARDTLLEWNSVLDKRSVAAGVYEMFQRRLLSNMRELLVPPNARESFGSVGMKKIIDMLDAPGGEFGADPIAGRDRVLTASLEQTIAELTKKLGPDPTRWQYGQDAYHHALIHHPLSPAINADTRKMLDVGPMPRGGDSYTITATGGADNQTSGGSLKMIADLERLGQLGRAEQSRPVRRSAEPALSRPVRVMEPRQVLPNRVLTITRGIGNRAVPAAPAVGDEQRRTVTFPATH